MTDMTDETIADLIAKASSDKITVAGTAARELLRRKDECIPYANDIVRLLQHGNAAIEDYAFRILERIGKPCGLAVIDALDGAAGLYRVYLISLLPLVTDFDSYFRLIESELRHGDEVMRFHAANCLGRCYDPQNPWPETAMMTLHQAVELLRSCRQNPELSGYRPQARLTLKHLDRVRQDAV